MKECRECGTIMFYFGADDDDFCMFCGAPLYESEYSESEVKNSVTPLEMRDYHTYMEWYEYNVLYPKYIQGNKKLERKFKKMHRKYEPLELLFYISLIAFLPCLILTSLCFNASESLEWLGWVFCIAGLFFSVVALIGVLRMIANDLSTAEGRHEAWTEFKEVAAKIFIFWSIGSFFNNRRK